MMRNITILVAIYLCQARSSDKNKARPRPCLWSPVLRRHIENPSVAHAPAPLLGGFQTTTRASVNWKLDFLKGKYNYSWEFILTLFIYFFPCMEVCVNWRTGGGGTESLFDHDWNEKNSCVIVQYGWLNKGLWSSKSAFILLYGLHTVQD